MKIHGLCCSIFVSQSDGEYRVGFTKIPNVPSELVINFETRRAGGIVSEEGNIAQMETIHKLR
jgi:hypothetical protein